MDWILSLLGQYVCVCVCVSHSGHIQLFATPWTVAHQAPLSMKVSRQEYWSGLPFPSPGHHPDPGIKPRSSALQVDSLPLNHQGLWYVIIFLHRIWKMLLFYSTSLVWPLPQFSYLIPAKKDFQVCHLTVFCPSFFLNIDLSSKKIKLLFTRMTQSFVIDKTTMGGQINLHSSFVAENKSLNFIFKWQVFFLAVIHCSTKYVELGVMKIEF